MLALVAIGSDSLGPVSIYVDLFGWWSSDVFLDGVSDGVSDGVLMFV